MRWRVLIWVLVSGTLLVWCLFTTQRSSHRGSNNGSISFPLAGPESVGAPPQLSTTVAESNPKLRGGFGYRIRNTNKKLEELMRDPRAILLENAFLDTRLALNQPIPAALRSGTDPGSYIIQSKGEMNDSFRQTLSNKSGRIVAYIPNNAYLVRIQADMVAQLAADPQVAAVVPFEPYYKIKPSLLVPLLNEGASAAAPSAASQGEVSIRALLFTDGSKDTLPQLQKGGIDVLQQEGSPFGSIADLRCSFDKVAWMARLPGVQEIELSRPRVAASDLSRARVGVASNSVTSVNYLGLTGSNVTVNVNDSGVDSNQADLLGRVVWDVPASGVDLNGHGTLVAGIIAGNGSQSLTVTNAAGSFMPSVPLQFRGFAPAANIFSISAGTHASPSATDSYLQQTASERGALISNNSWQYTDDPEYDLGAASYDAAVRDALPGVPGSQPLLFVFAAGNSGGGADDGTGGIPGSIQSPGTAKNVITVGAIEQARFITNQTWTCGSNGPSLICQTNTPWLRFTDSSNQVASFSSRGNVGIGIESGSGRFKPDLVAPGTFVISARSTQWDEVGYYSESNNVFNIVPDANYEQVLSNLNLGIGPYYRFESGTSIGAAEVSGTLALMQEFFQKYLARTNSPALMKALLINGARSLGGGYDLRTAGPTNLQGWGLVQLPNSIPSDLTNDAATSRSMLLFDQSPAEALATGHRRTRLVSVSVDAQELPLRVTLAWTDPPGNPVAGLKLVNDLDLIVTNLETGEVYWGNDIPPGSDFNSAWQPGTEPYQDMVNNVENVYLQPPLSSNYSVTISGRRIGVNAVTDHPDNVVQDYALVMSSGDGQITNALTATDIPLSSTPLPLVTFITNSFFGDDVDSGSILLQQRAGANAPLLGTNSIALPGLTNALFTIGTLNQWHFYVFTNGTSFTNAAFFTFLAQPLSLVPGGDASYPSATPGQIWSASADLDLCVSRDPGLTNLNPVTIAASDMSLRRGGSQVIVYSNATPGLYYIAVKCEALQGAEYGFVADVSELPYVQDDSQGNELLRGFPQPVVVPSGTASQPGVSYTFFLTPDSFPVHRVVATNTLLASSLSDLETTLSHDSSTVVLENDFTNVSPPDHVFVYDDSDEGDLPGALPTEGPGSLRQFAGQDALGLWLMTSASTNRSATNLTSWILVERQQDLTGAIDPTILPGSCRDDFILVPAQATNLTVIATMGAANGSVSLVVYPADSSSSNCSSLMINSAGAMGLISVDQTSHPPLNPGLYIVRTCNTGPGAVDVGIQANFVFGPAAPPPVVYSFAVPTPIPDDAVCSSGLMITNTDRILSAEVGVRIDHPRVSDLVLTLVAPDGTRVLLDQGRGGSSAADLGATLTVTNSIPVSFSGGPVAVTNTFDTGENSGTIVINYDFFALPDEMRLYYETNLLYDSGLVSFKGSTNISYGPGASTSFTIIMNEGGNSESNTAWFYSVTTTRLQPLYLTFTENTNLTITPIKFASPPFTNLTSAPGGGPSPNGIFYLPEESLGQLVEKSAYGRWDLEILDNRTGATNPPPTLLSWQLALELANSTPVPILLSHSQPLTNLLGPGQIQAYEIDAPDWANFSTNWLLGASAPVNLLFNSAVPPTGTNAGDLVLARGSTAGSWIFRTNMVPGLVPGSRYYLGIQNTNSSTVSVGFMVDFDVDSVITLTSGIPYANTNLGPFNNEDFYRFVASLAAVRLQFEVNSPSSDVTLVVRKGPPLPSLASYDFISANPGTNDEVIVIHDFARPTPLAGEWFLTVVDVTGSPAAYSILATEFQDYGTNLVLLDPTVSGNTLCLSWNSLPGIHYIFQGKTRLADTNWTTLSPTLTASDYTTAFCQPLPTPFHYFRVTEGLALVPAIPILSSVAYATNGTLLQWTDITNSSFSVQWASALVPPNWNSFAAPVTSSNGVFEFLDDGSQSGGRDTQRFYRLRQLR